MKSKSPRWETTPSGDELEVKTTKQVEKVEPETRISSQIHQESQEESRGQEEKTFGEISANGLSELKIHMSSSIKNRA